MRAAGRPLLALTQGDPAGVGPELLLALAAEPTRPGEWRPLLLAERAVLEAAGDAGCELHWLAGRPNRRELERVPDGAVPAIDPVGKARRVSFGSSGPADAAGALAALDTGIALALGGTVDALVTAPVSKASIARHCDPGFRGHTDYLAAACGLERYGRDYLMAFLAPDLRVALLSTHLPLRQALEAIDQAAVVDALLCLHGAVAGRIAVAGINPHAGEGGLMGDEDERIVRPAVEEARRRGVDAHGPESADSLFARARGGEFDWVLALYHDQGLIAVKTAAFGRATNWTLGLPFLRTSVDHGTAFAIAGQGRADAAPFRQVIGTTLDLLAAGRGRGRHADR